MNTHDARDIPPTVKRILLKLLLQDDPTVRDNPNVMKLSENVNKTNREQFNILFYESGIEQNLMKIFEKPELVY